MAFVPQDTTQQQQPNLTNQPIAAGGQGVAGSTKNASVPGQNLPAQPSAQLSAYLAANQPQTQQTANTIAGNVTNQIGQTNNAINQAASTYQGNLYNVPTDQTTNTQVATAPSQLTPQQQQSFTSELGAASQAPNSANTFESSSPYQNLTQQIQSNVEQANLWSSGNNVPNLTTALAPYEPGNPTSGDVTLDALLLSQTPQAYQTIQNAAAPAQNLQGNLNTATTTSDQALLNAIAQDNAATQAAQGAGQTYATNLNSYLQNALTQAQNAQTGQQATNNTLQSDLANYQMTPSDAEALGIAPGQATTYSTDYNSLAPLLANINANVAQIPPTANLPPTNPFGSPLIPVNLANYLTQPTLTTPTMSNVATPQNYSDVAALLSLMGNQSPTNLPINPSTSNQAGLANQLPSDAFNNANATEALNSLLSNIESGASHMNPMISTGPIGTINSEIPTAYQDLATLTGTQPPSTIGYPPPAQTPTPTIIPTTPGVPPVNEQAATSILVQMLNSGTATPAQISTASQWITEQSNGQSLSQVLQNYLAQNGPDPAVQAYLASISPTNILTPQGGIS